MRPKSRFSKRIFGHSAGSPKLDRPYCKRFWIGGGKIFHSEEGQPLQRFFTKELPESLLNWALLAGCLSQHGREHSSSTTLPVSVFMRCSCHMWSRWFGLLYVMFTFLSCLWDSLASLQHHLPNVANLNWLEREVFRGTKAASLTPDYCETIPSDEIEMSTKVSLHKICVS